MFSLKHKSRFIFSIGEEGIILLYFKNGVFYKRYFIKNKDSDAISDLKSCLGSDKKAPLYLVLNHMDQNYVLQSVPGVNRINSYLSIRTKVEQFNDDYDIRSILLIKKPNKFDKNWYYLCVLSKAKHLIEYWLNFFVETGLNFKGILMFPIELSNIAEKILHNNLSKWKIIVASTKTGGYRQVVMKNGKMVFTRLIFFSNDDILPGIIAGGIHQEIQNTIQSLTKFGYCMGELIDLCIIVQEDIKASFSAIKLSENRVSILTPYELGRLLNLKLVVNEKDKFCDTTILFNSFLNQPLIVFHTKETKELYLLNYLYLYAPRSFMLFILILVFISILFLLNLSSNINTAYELKMKEDLVKNRLAKFSQNYNAKKVDEIYDFINISNILSKIEYSPLEQIKYVEKLKLPDVELKSFEWNFDEVNNHIVTKLKFNFELNKSIFDIYQKLHKRLYRNFRTQKVNISNLPTILPSEGQDIIVDVSIEEVM